MDEPWSLKEHLQVQSSVLRLKGLDERSLFACWYLHIRMASMAK